MVRKGGKYAHITSNLPRLQGIGSEYRENLKYQERVEQTKREILMEPGDNDVMPESQSGVPLLIDDQVSHAERAMKNAHRHFLRRCAGQNHATSLASAYAAARDLKERVESWLSNTNLLIEAYAQLMLTAMENEGVTSLRLGDRPLSTWDEPYTTVKDKTANLAWAMRECEHCQAARHDHRTDDGGLLVGTHREKDPVTQQEYEGTHYFKPNELRKSLMLPWQTLDSLVRRMLLEGAELPPGVDVWSKAKIRLGGGEE